MYYLLLLARVFLSMCVLRLAGQVCGCDGVLLSVRQSVGLMQRTGTRRRWHLETKTPCSTWVRFTLFLLPGYVCSAAPTAVGCAGLLYPVYVCCIVWAVRQWAVQGLYPICVLCCAHTDGFAGLLYRDGEGVAKDHAAALALFEQAAKLGVSQLAPANSLFSLVSSLIHFTEVEVCTLCACFVCDVTVCGLWMCVRGRGVLDVYV